MSLCVRFFSYECRNKALWICRTNDCCSWLPVRDVCDLLDFRGITDDELESHVSRSCLRSWAELTEVGCHEDSFDRADIELTREELCSRRPGNERFISHHGCLTLASIADTPKAKHFAQWCRCVGDAHTKYECDELTQSDARSVVVSSIEKELAAHESESRADEDDVEEDGDFVLSMVTDTKREPETLVLAIEEFDSSLAIPENEESDSDGKDDADFYIVAYQRRTVARHRYLRDAALRELRRHVELERESRARYESDFRRALARMDEMARCVYGSYSRHRELRHQSVLDKQLEREREESLRASRLLQLRALQTILDTLTTEQSVYALNLQRFAYYRGRANFRLQSEDPFVEVLDNLDLGIAVFLRGLRNCLHAESAKVEKLRRRSIENMLVEFRKRQRDYYISIWDWKERILTPGLYEELRATILKYSTKPEWCENELQELRTALASEEVSPMRSRSSDEILRETKTLGQSVRSSRVSDKIMNQLIRLKHHIEPLLLIVGQ